MNVLRLFSIQILLMGSDLLAQSCPTNNAITRSQSQILTVCYSSKYKPAPEKAKALEVLMGEFVIAKHSPTVTSLMTRGVASCIVVTLYNAKTKVGAIAHIPFSHSGREAIETLLEKIEEAGFNPADFTAQITNGPIATDRALAEGIRNELMKRKVPITKYSICEEQICQSQPMHFSLDLQTGETTGSKTMNPGILFDIDSRLLRTVGTSKLQYVSTP